MLDKQLARNLLPLVNSALNEDLIEYANYRIKILNTTLENSVEINDILRVQGQIKELRRLLTLKVEAIEDAQ